MAAKPGRFDAGVQLANAASWLGASGVAGIYSKTGTGLTYRRSDNTEVSLNSPSTIYSNVTVVNSVTTGEIDAQSYTMPANTLFADGQQLEITIGSSHAANTNSATYRLYIDGTAILTQARTVSSEAEMSRVILVRSASNAGRWMAMIQNGATSSGNTSALSLTFSNAIIIKTTVEGPTANGDMVGRFMRISWWP